MFSVIAILEYFLLLEALKDSSVSIFNRLSQYRISSFSQYRISFFVTKTINQLTYHSKIIFLELSETWSKMELPGMNYSSFKKTRGFIFGIVHPC